MSGLLDCFVVTDDGSGVYAAVWVVWAVVGWVCWFIRAGCLFVTYLLGVLLVVLCLVGFVC